MSISSAYSDSIDMLSAEFDNTFGDQIEAADLVVIATVKGYKKHVVPNLSRELNTIIQLSDIVHLTAEGGKQVRIDNASVRILGGVVENEDGSKTTRIPTGTPEFDMGERLVLFLAGNGHVQLPLVGTRYGLGVIRIDSDNYIQNQSHQDILGIHNNIIVYESSFNKCSIDDAPENKVNMIDQDGNVIILDPGKAKEQRVAFTCPNNDGVYVRGNDRPSTLDRRITSQGLIEYIVDYMRTNKVPHLRNLESALNPDLMSPLYPFNTDEKLNMVDQWLRRAISLGEEDMIPPTLFQDFMHREKQRERIQRK